MCTRGINLFGVEKTRALVGHQNIATTMRYDRNKMSPEDQTKAYDVIDPVAPEPTVKCGRPQKHPLQPNLKKIAKEESKALKKETKAKTAPRDLE